MEHRLRKASRVLEVQKKLHEMAEWKLADLQRRVAELQEMQAVTIQALNEDEALHGLFVDSTARRLQRIAGEETQVQHARDAQAKLVLERAMQVKRTERMLDALAVDHRRASEKKDYLELLDGLATKRDASLP